MAYDQQPCPSARPFSPSLPAQGGAVKTVLGLNTDMAPGLLVVSITVGDIPAPSRW
jgi:hypothetical protein